MGKWILIGGFLCGKQVLTWSDSDFIAEKTAKKPVSFKDRFLSVKKIIS